MEAGRLNISVAMTTLNGLPFLPDQLRSVVRQLHSGDELVISDDGSGDGTAELLCEAAARDGRIRLLQGPRRGVSANVERAISACRGEVIFLCDQDDIWHPDKREKVVSAFREDGPCLVLHDARVIGAQGEVLCPSFLGARGYRRGFWHNLWKNGYIGCCMAFSRRLLPQILPFPKEIPMFDQWIGVRAERFGGVTVFPAALIDYRRHGGNATAQTHRGFSQMLRWRLGLMRAMLTFGGKRP